MKEPYLTLAQAAKLAPTRPSANAVWRWCRKGVLSRSGERVRLGHVRVGGRVFTTEADMQRFFSELAEADAEHFNANDGTNRAKEVRRTSSQRDRAVAKAEDDLRKAGV